MIEILKLLNKKYGDSRFFQNIVRDYLRQKAGQNEQYRFYETNNRAY